MIASSPAISVLLPVYNAQNYLCQGVQSILDQTFGDFELIAVDDGSTDRSLSILKSLAARDPRITLISRPNTGIAGALNDALAVAKGEFIARMDADDVAFPERFANQLTYLRDHVECVLLGSRVLLMDPYGVPLFSTEQKLEHSEIEAGLLNADGWALVHPATMMRTDALRAVGGYRRQWVPIEDMDLFLRLAEIGRIANLPEVLLHYRQHMASANRKKFSEQETKKRACIKEAYGRRGQTFPKDWTPPPRELALPREEILRWGWGALNFGAVSAARKHAWKLVLTAPTRLDSWRLLYCALRGR